MQPVLVQPILFLDFEVHTHRYHRRAGVFHLLPDVIVKIHLPIVFVAVAVVSFVA